jgi:hypothetical protein
MKNKQANWSISKLSLESGLYQSDGSVAILADGDRVALVDCQTKFKRGEGYKAQCPIRDANARLIAAAPGLLEACKKAATCASIPDSVMEIIRAEIAKATKV